MFLCLKNNPTHEPSPAGCINCKKEMTHIFFVIEVILSKGIGKNSSYSPPSYSHNHKLPFL